MEIGGTERNKVCMQDYITKYLQDSPAQVITLQEASTALLDKLEKPPEPTPETTGDERAMLTNENARDEANGRPADGYIAVKGDEPGPSVAVLARESLVFGIRRDRFIIHFGGCYTLKGERIERQALNRILFATVKLKKVFLRGGGE